MTTVVFGYFTEQSWKLDFPIAFTNKQSMGFEVLLCPVIAELLFEELLEHDCRELQRVNRAFRATFGPKMEKVIRHNHCLQILRPGPSLRKNLENTSEKHRPHHLGWVQYLSKRQTFGRASRTTVSGVYAPTGARVISVSLRSSSSCLFRLDEHFATGTAMQTGPMETVPDWVYRPKRCFSKDLVFIPLNITRQKGRFWFLMEGSYDIMLDFSPPVSEYWVENWIYGGPERGQQTFWYPQRLFLPTPWQWVLNGYLRGSAFAIYFPGGETGWRTVSLACLEFTEAMMRREAVRGGFDPAHWAVLPMTLLSEKWWDIDTEKMPLKVLNRQVNLFHVNGLELAFNGVIPGGIQVYWLAFNTLISEDGYTYKRFSR